MFFVPIDEDAYGENAEMQSLSISILPDMAPYIEVIEGITMVIVFLVKAFATFLSVYR